MRIKWVSNKEIALGIVRGRLPSKHKRNFVAYFDERSSLFRGLEYNVFATRRNAHAGLVPQ